MLRIVVVVVRVIIACATVLLIAGCASEKYASPWGRGGDTNRSYIERETYTSPLDGSTTSVVRERR